MLRSLLFYCRCSNLADLFAFGVGVVGVEGCENAF